MRKLLSLLLSFALMFSMVLPVGAADLTADGATLTVDGIVTSELTPNESGTIVYNLVVTGKLDGGANVTYYTHYTINEDGSISPDAEEMFSFTAQEAQGLQTHTVTAAVTVSKGFTADSNVYRNLVLVKSVYNYGSRAKLENKSGTFTVIIVPDSDTTAPVIDITTPANGTTYEIKSQVLANWTVTDESSISVERGTVEKGGLIDTSSLGEKSFTVYAEDIYGNHSEQTVTYTVVDTIDPTISSTINPTEPNGLNGWYNSNVEVSFSYTDSGSGIDTSKELPIDYTISEDGIYSQATYTVYDLAGNSASVTIPEIMVDKTKPIIAAPENGQIFILNSTNIPVWTATDTMSGIDPTKTYITGFDTSSVGTRSYTITAADKAGNSDTITRTYQVIYDFSGFLKPIETGAKVVNTAKAGSAIPVKFSLKGNQGMQIFEIGYPKSVVANITSDGLVLDPIETYVTTVTSGGSTLSYDPVTDQYTYVWKTDKAWSGFRVLIVKFADGKEYTAAFKFSK